MTIDLSRLHPTVRQRAEAVLFRCEKEGLDVFIPETGCLRTPDMQKRIYGKEQWTCHYIGCAVDIQPRIKCKLEEWEEKFNRWPYWNHLQCEIAVECGFDKPQKWQLERDRPHVQCLFGLEESVLKSMWYASAGSIGNIWKYIDLHIKPEVIV